MCDRFLRLIENNHGLTHNGFFLTPKIGKENSENHIRMRKLYIYILHEILRYLYQLLVFFSFFFLILNSIIELCLKIFV